MRSTLNIASNTALNNILDNFNRVLKIQNQMSSGKRVINPSDDPLATNAGMRLDSLLSRINQFGRNIDVGVSSLALSDATLDEVGNILQSARSLTIAGASETTTQEMRRTQAIEITSLMSELVTIGNRKNGERYLFGGTETQQPPYTIVGSRYVNYQGNENSIDVEVDLSSRLAINVTGAQVFGSMNSIVKGRDLSPDANLGVNTSTRLQDLNAGKGVPKGSINIRYSDFPSLGLDVDLSSADTLEDIKDVIEQATIAASGALPSTTFIRVDINPELNGIQLREYDTGTNLPLAVPPGAPIVVSEVASNTVARDLGIVGTGQIVADPLLGVTVSQLVGGDTDPLLSKRTLLADLDGYADNTFTITNGDIPGALQFRELNDTNNIMDSLNLNGLTKGITTGTNGELYVNISRPAVGQYDVNVYRTPSATALPGDLVATATVSANGTVVLNQANNSGVTGTMLMNYVGAVGTNQEINISTIFPENFQATINVPAFIETGDTNTLLDKYQLRGLESGVSTDATNNVYFRVTDGSGVGNGPFTVAAFSDAALTTQIASGTYDGTAAVPIQRQGVVQLRGSTGFENITGTVQLEFPTGLVGGPFTSSVQATFATVDDLINAVKSSNTYTTARIAANGQGLEFIGKLGGATLTVSEAYTSLTQQGDELNQLRNLNLAGIIKGTNADRDGNLYTSIVEVTAGTLYNINFYRDAARTNLVAQGVSTAATGAVTITEQNKSGISGSVAFAFSANDNNIVITPGALTVRNDQFRQVSQLDIPGIVPGINADPAGRLYASVTDLGGPGPYQVDLFSDAARTRLVARGSSAAINGRIALTEQNASGIATAANPASLFLNYRGNDSDIIIKPGGLGQTGQVRQANIFSTFNDLVDGMNAQDVDALSGLLGNLTQDLDRQLQSRADLGSRQRRLELLEVRHADEQINFTQIRSKMIDLDFAEAVTRFQAAQNVFEASLRTTAQIIPLSLVDFI